MVAAPGNSPAPRLGYPALVPGAVIATALDWSADDAGYNVPTTGTMATVRAAFGGTSADPFGYIVADGDRRPFYGTSFAAAVVTASYLA